MAGFNSFFKLFRAMDTKKMRAAAKKVAKSAHKSYLFIMADMAWCGFRYTAGYSDYALFDMYNMDSAQRRTVLTRGKNNMYVKALNDRTAWKYFEEKPAFLKTFAEFTRRTWVDLRTSGAEELRRFSEPLEVFIAKPIDGSHGDGVEKITSAEISDWAALRERLLSNGQELCEELVKQHPEMDRLWSGAVNTVRLVTIVADGTAHIVASYLRIGGGDRPVDNFNAGGMVAPLDRETGKIKCHAVDKAGNIFVSHPKTGVRFEGFQVPMWAEALDFAKRAALIVPSVRYVAWDVGITPNGPVFVEGNHYPGHDIYGLPAQTPDKRGVLPDWEAVIPLKSLK